MFTDLDWSSVYSSFVAHDIVVNPKLAEINGLQIRYNKDLFYKVESVIYDIGYTVSSGDEYDRGENLDESLRSHEAKTIGFKIDENDKDYAIFTSSPEVWKAYEITKYGFRRWASCKNIEDLLLKAYPDTLLGEVQNKFGGIKPIINTIERVIETFKVKGADGKIHEFDSEDEAKEFYDNEMKKYEY